MFENLHFEVAPREYDENTEWECVLDAVYTFEQTNNNNENNIIIIQPPPPTTVNCIFSRVYLDDMDLISMNDDDHHTTDNNANDNDVNNCITDGGGGGGGGAADVLSEHQQQQLPTAEMTPSATTTTVPWLPPDVYRRQCALRAKISKLMFSLCPDGEPSMLEQSFGRLTDVHFDAYKSAHRSNKGGIRYPKRALPEEDSEENGWESASDTFSAAAATSSSAVGNVFKNGHHDHKHKLSLDQLLNFDFGFCPTRDAALVAKNADKYFAKGKVMSKYWFQRNRYFSKLNDGILMDREGWFSVTPERVARHVADRVVLLRDCTILDAFTGVGGNAIQFALRGAYVIAVDIDPVKLRCARQNARVYGVQNRICFICGSFFHVTASLFGALQAKRLRRDGIKRSNNGDDKADSASKEDVQADPASEETVDDSYPHGIDAVFLSPPWGGPDYMHTKRPFDLHKDMELDGVNIFRMAQQISPNIAYFLPKNTRNDQLIALAGPGGCVELEQTVLNEKVKALHAYYGLLAATN